MIVKSLSLFMLLALLALSLPAARAQGPGTWVPVPCNPDGSTPVTDPSYDNDGFLGMWWMSQGGIQGTTSNTYPQGAAGHGAFSPNTDDGPLIPSSLVLDAAAGNENDQRQSANGTVQAQVSGAVSAYYTWQYQGPPGQGGTPPDHMDFLVKTMLEGFLEFQPQSGLSGSVTVTDSLGDSVPPAGAFSQVARHLIRVGAPGSGPVEVDLLGSVGLSLSNSLLDYDPSSPPPYNGPITIRGHAQIIGGVMPNSRELTISSSYDPTSFKSLVSSGAVDANGDPIYACVQHTPDPDGTMRGDFGLPFGYYAPSVYNYASVTYAANPTGSWYKPLSQYNWFSSLKQSGDSGTLYEDDDSIPNYTNEYAEPILDEISTQTIVVPGDNGKVDHIHLTYTDGGDGASATANYYMTLHAPYEQNYKDHKQDMTDDTNEQEIGTYGIQAGYDGATISAEIDVLNPWIISVKADTLLPLGWLSGAIGVDIEHSLSGYEQIGYIVSASDTKAGDYSYPEMVPHYLRHYGKTDCFGASGYTGTQPYQLWDPAVPGMIYRLHKPYGNASSGPTPN